VEHLHCQSRIVRGVEEAKSDPELAAAMKLSIDLLRDQPGHQIGTPPDGGREEN
jgi:hypothetical protein